MKALNLTATRVAAFRRQIWRHFRQHGRPLPWRYTRHPYRILVSEVMLQQTQVARVIPKYKQFLKSFPTVQALAAASARDVVAAWQGLGYNRRALALKRAAATIVVRHGGRVPADAAALRELPGLGPYTAAAVAVLAFNQPLVLIETNIRSVYIHEFFTAHRPRRAAGSPRQRHVSDSQLLPLISQTLDRRHPAAWYHALMDYGAKLKKQHGNPNRFSSHYARQPRFAGSMRQVRGRIITLLTQHRALTAHALSQKIDREMADIRAATRQLEQEGFIVKKGRQLTLAP